MAPQPTAAGKKRNRDDILRDLKANRFAAAEKATQPSLGPKFTKVVQALESSRFEKNGRGRNIDHDGRKWTSKTENQVGQGRRGTLMSGFLMPDKGESL